MLKITESCQPDKLVLQLEGRIVGPWVRELRDICEQALKHQPAINLSLGGVEFIDQEGVTLLSTLLGRGVTLTDCQPFIAAQLRDVLGFKLERDA